MREHRCLICDTPLDIIAHHEGLGQNMMGGKPPDTHCIPLCTRCHAHRHGSAWMGVVEYPRDVRQVIINLLTEFLSVK